MKVVRFTSADQLPSELAVLSFGWPLLAIVNYNVVLAYFMLGLINEKCHCLILSASLA